MAEPPTKLILDMQNSGMRDDEVIIKLREQGYSEKDINDGFNQAKVKSTIRAEDSSAIGEIETAGTPPVAAQPTPAPAPAPAPAADEFVPAPSPEGYEQAAPTPSQESWEGYGYGYPQAQPTAYGYGEAASTSEAFEEIAESIVEEKWRSFTEKIGDLQGWKESVDREITRIDSRIERIDDAMTGINAALLEKVGEYGKSIKGLGSDVKAVEKALSQILGPLMRNIKELKGITENLKAKRGKKS